MNYKEIVYYISYVVFSILFLTTPLKNYQSMLWFCKVLLVFIISTSITYSMIKKNAMNDNTIFGLLLFLNVLILIPLLLESVNYKKENLIPIHYLSIIIILLLLYNFSSSDFKINNGILTHPNNKWILGYVLAVSIWCMAIHYKNITPRFRLISILLVSSPLLFSLEDYYLVRVSLLGLAIALKYRYFY